LRPQANRRAAERAVERRAEQPDLMRASGFGELRRLDD
jgi:hypothetical protein